MAAFTFGPGHPFPAGTTVSAYQDKGQNPSGQPAGATVATATVSAGGALTVTGLTDGVTYWIVGVVAGQYLWSRITVPAAVIPDNAALDARVTAVEGSRKVTSGTATPVLGDLQPYGTYFQLDGSGNVIAEWVRADG
jgi:hypothetical protein